jgi:DNA invertase Pin-like site-specific DNA recombinase
VRVLAWFAIYGRLMLTALDALAEFERELIRPFKMTAHQIKEALRRRDNGEPMRETHLAQHDFEAGGSLRR